MDSIQVLLESQLKPHHSPFLLAIEEDLYEERGLEVNLVEPDQSDGSLEPLLDEDVDYAITRSLNLVVSYLQSDDVVGISRFFNTNAGVLFRDDKLTNIDDLSTDTRIVCNGLSEDWAATILNHLIPDDDVEPPLESVDFDPSVIESDPVTELHEGKYDVMIYAGVNPEGVQFEQAEFEVDFWFFDDYSIPSASDLVISTRSSKAESEPNEAQDFIHATHEAAKSIEQDPDPARQLIKENYEHILEQPGANPLLFTSLSEVTSDFSQDYQAYTDWGEFVTDTSELSGFVDVDRLTDERFIPLESVSF